MAEPQHLQEFPVHLAADGQALGLDRFTGEPSWYAAYEQTCTADGPTGRLVSWHLFDCSWDSWEMHPSGDEIVLCVEGAIDLIQDVDGTTVSTALNSGQWAINTAGTWHTADVPPDSTASCVFITCGLGTQHRPR
jgi:hypothetical protein